MPDPIHSIMTSELDHAYSLEEWQYNANVYKNTLALMIAAIAFLGVGNKIFGITLANNLSVYFIYAMLFVQASLLKFVVPRILIWTYAYILFQTLVFNFSWATYHASMIKFIGITIISGTIFCFVSINRLNMIGMARSYYYLSFMAALFAIIQTSVFLLFGKAIYLQDYIGVPEVKDGKLTHQILGLLPRAASITTEPAHFALLLLPGVFIAVLAILGRAKPLGLTNKWTAATIITGLLLSFSLIGYASLIFILFYLTITWNTRTMRIIYIIPGLMIISWIFYISIIQFPFFQAKIETFLQPSQALNHYKFTGTDLSAFALISNALVAKSALVHSHLLGTGLDTHAQNYDRYMPHLFYSSQVLMALNKTDAGSLFIRVASEFGVPGLLALAWFLYRFKLRRLARTSPNRIINDMCFIYLIVYGARTGSYLNPALWLFAAMYYYSYLLGQKSHAHGVNRNICFDKG